MRSGNTVETLRKHCRNTVETLWKHCTNNVETLYEECGIPITVPYPVAAVLLRFYFTNTEHNEKVKAIENADFTRGFV